MKALRGVGATALVPANQLCRNLFPSIASHTVS